MTGPLGMGERMRRIFVPLIDRTAPLRGALADAGGVLSLGRFPESKTSAITCRSSRACSRYRLSRAEISELVRQAVAIPPGAAPA